MLNTVKDILSTVGDSAGSYAKSFGLSSADLAKTIGTGTVALAKDVGPKRALIGAAIVIAAVGGGIVLMRYLRRREQERLERESMEASDAAAGLGKRSISNAERRAVNTARSLGQH